jgi:hypothetical protein
MSIRLPPEETSRLFSVRKGSAMSESDATGMGEDTEGVQGGMGGSQGGGTSGSEGGS